MFLFGVALTPPQIRTSYAGVESGNVLIWGGVFWNSHESAHYITISNKTPSKSWNPTAAQSQLEPPGLETIKFDTFRISKTIVLTHLDKLRKCNENPWDDQTVLNSSRALISGPNRWKSKKKQWESMILANALNSHALVSVPQIRQNARKTMEINENDECS